ncbi:hypothetical protein GCM10027168_32770 [Streptomyces capparidis]
MATTAAADVRTERHPRFSLFAECMLAGVWCFLGALPLVTAPASFAAACAHVRRHLAGERAGMREFAADWRAAAGGRGWLAGLLGWAALAVLLLDVRVGSSGSLPGGPLVVAVGAAGAAAVTVVGLRAAAGWRPGERWCRLARDGAARAVADPAGSGLLAGGLVVLAVVTWALPPLLLPTLGCLAAAAVAVERRAGFEETDAPAA